MGRGATGRGEFMSEFEKIVTFRPAFDKRNTNPKKNYGIHGVELRMVLRGPLGATQFLLYTNWHLPHVQSEQDKALLLKQPGIDDVDLYIRHPFPADRGHHWSVPIYNGQECRDCDLLPSGKCYYDGSGLNAEQTYHALLEKGDAGVWADLEAYYHELANRPVTTGGESL